MSKSACPLCGHPTDPAHKPFCSRRCHDRDLLAWLGDGYAVPGRSDDAEMLDRPEPRD